MLQLGVMDVSTAGQLPWHQKCSDKMGFQGKMFQCEWRQELQHFSSLITSFPCILPNISLSKFYWSGSECVLELNTLVLASEALAFCVCVSALKWPVSFEIHDSIQCSNGKKLHPKPYCTGLLVAGNDD